MGINIAVLEGTLSVECDGRSIFDSLPMQTQNSAEQGSGVSGSFWLAVLRATLEFKDMSIRQTSTESRAAAPPAPPAASLPTRERFRGDDMRLVEMIVRDMMDSPLD
jgi:hypothetical protein